MIYRTKTDMPGIPAGELLVLDETNAGHPVYRGVDNKNLWLRKEDVESTDNKFEEVPAGNVKIKYETVSIDTLQKEISDKIVAREEEILVAKDVVAIKEVLLVDNIIK